MERPYVICHMLMALDGKIDGPFFTADETVPALHKYGEVRKLFDCPATVYGTTTMAGGYADGYVSDLPETELTFPREDYLGGCDVKNYIVSLDGEGVLAWHGKYLEKKGRPKAHVIEVLTEKVSDRYLAYLRGFGISYLFAGKETIDCEALLRKLKTLFGIERVLLAGGGITNQAFAAAGLIDELSIVLAPTADGDSGSASLFETGGFSSAAPVAFSLKAVEQIEGDTLWLRYTSKIRGGRHETQNFRKRSDCIGHQVG